MDRTFIEILQGLEPLEIRGESPQKVRISGIEIDSRKVEPGYAFVAVRGTRTDGHDYIEMACNAGAVAVVGEYWPDALELPNGVCFVQLADTTGAPGRMASAFYNHPSSHLKVLGVTGTNGKTSIATLLYQCFTRLGYRCGLIGTVENRIGNRVVSASHTTPDAVRVQRLLADMCESGCSHVFMEVSSHALDQGRVSGVQFDGAVFTNLSHDHLDYHKTFAEYRDAKKKLFDGLDKSAFALINTDDRNGRFMVQNTKAEILYYGLKSPSDYKGKILENGVTGLHLQVNQQEMHSPLIGAFSAYNILASFGAAALLGEDELEVLAALSAVKGAPGRFEIVQSPGAKGTSGIIDYAHTPDALENVLDTLIQLRTGETKIITVVGCGGDRDKTKRPEMARVAATRSDQLIMTSDNPRSEKPEDILADMEKGLDIVLKQKTLIISDREQAIKTAVQLAGSTDVVLVAGKGHETYQEILGVRHPFDDKALLLQYLKEK